MKQLVVYKCESNKFFVGTTEQDGTAVINSKKPWNLAPWLQMYAPVEILSIEPMTDKTEIDEKVLAMIDAHGIDSTRGVKAGCAMLAYTGSLVDYKHLLPPRPTAPVITEAQLHAMVEKRAQEIADAKVQQVMMDQKVNVRADGKLVSAKEIAKQLVISPAKLNQLLADEGYQTSIAYREGENYWLATEKGRAADFMDDVPLRSGTKTTTCFTAKIYQEAFLLPYLEIIG